jgi:hypothetical protein
MGIKVEPNCSAEGLVAGGDWCVDDWRFLRKARATARMMKRVRMPPTVTPTMIVVLLLEVSEAKHCEADWGSSTLQQMDSYHVACMGDNRL